MQASLGVLLSIVIASGVAATAQQAGDTTSKGGSSTKMVTFSGCVAADPSAAGAFRLSESKDGTTYRLTGVDVHRYAGQRVTISGNSPKRLHIVGGLYPSPNVAAQAGAIDPAQAAIAAQNPQRPDQALPELRVKSVRAAPGACP